MHAPRRLSADSVDYPAGLHALRLPPSELWVAGPVQAGPGVAIVGTRRPDPEAARFAFELAAEVAAAGGAVLSGGAVGIDAAAHEGALAAGGRTVVVAATGHASIYPAAHGPLYARVLDCGGTLWWPFAPDARARRHGFFLRNGVLVALADALVIVQAAVPSGALNAAAWARRLGKPLWVVPGPPWAERFRGCLVELERGAHPLTSPARLLESIGLGTPPARARPARGRGTQGRRRACPLSAPLAAEAPEGPEEARMAEVAENDPLHIDELTVRSGLSPGMAATVLLTLALKNVLVEGPDGFYRRGYR